MVRYVVALVMVGILLVGCGSDSAPDQLATGSPLEDELGFASEPERRRFQLISMQRDADATMVQCMKQAGFFYAVRPAEDIFRSGAFVGDGSREWTVENGLGILSSFVDAIATDSIAPVDAALTNLDYVASLTPEQQVNYDRALVGDLTAPTPSATTVVEPGCWEKSYLDIVNLLAVIDEFEPELGSLNARLNADPRVQEFQLEWSECMAAAGYNYPNEQALIDEVYARLLDVELVESGGFTQIGLDDSLGSFERAAGLASFDCRQGFVAELDQLRGDYEREFLDDNRFRIADLLASPS